jgi:TP901 family phage tail tape measure protein
LAIRLAELEVVLKGAIGQFLQEMDKADAKLDSVALKSKQLGSQTQKMGLQFAALGAAISVPLGLATRAIVKTGAEFEQTMRNVQSVSGGTEEQFKELSNFAKEMGRATVFSARQAGEGMYFLASAGQSASEQMQSLPAILDLAAATQSDLASTTEIVVSQLNAFGLSARQAGRVSNVLAASIGASQLTAERLGIALPFVSSSASALGISLEETVGTLGVLVSSGIRASSAGRLLGTSLLKLTDISSEGAATLEQMGLTVDDINPQLHSMSEIVGALERGHLDAEKAMKIFGAEGARVWLTLSQQGSEKLADLTEKITGTDKAAEMAAIQLDSFSGAARLMKSAIEDIEIIIFEALREDLVKLVMTVRDAIVAFGKFADEHRELIRLLARVVVFGGGTIGAITTLGGVFLIFAGQVLKSVTALNDFRHIALTRFSPVLKTIATDLFVIVGALAALAVGLEIGNYLNQWEDFRTTVQRALALISFIFDLPTQVKSLWDKSAQDRMTAYWQIFAGVDPVTGQPFTADTVANVSPVDAAISAIEKTMYGASDAAKKFADGVNTVNDAVATVPEVARPAIDLLGQITPPPAPTAMPELTDEEMARIQAQKDREAALRRNILERRGMQEQLLQLTIAQRDALIETYGTEQELITTATEQDLERFDQLERLIERYHESLKDPTPWDFATEYMQAGVALANTAINSFSNIVGNQLAKAFGQATSTAGKFFQSLLAQFAAAIAKALVLQGILSIFFHGVMPTQGFGALLFKGFQSPEPDFFARYEGGRFANLFMQGINRELGASTGGGAPMAMRENIREQGLAFEPVIEINEASEMTYVRIYDKHYEPRRKQLEGQRTEAD